MCNLTLPTTSDFQDVLPCVLPFYHIYGMTMIMLSKLALGNKLVTLPKFTSESFLKLLDEHKATVLHIVPPIGILFFLNFFPFSYIFSLKCSSWQIMTPLAVNTWIASEM